MVTEKRPNKNRSSARIANSESDAVAFVAFSVSPARPVEYQKNHAPPISRSSKKMVKPGTKYFSNCSRAFCAGKLPPSLVSNNEAPRLRASSSSSSFSARSFSSRRIWNQLTKVTMTPRPRKTAATVPVKEPANWDTPKAARKITSATARFTSPFCFVLRSIKFSL
jgi:hypothetical protein